MSRFDLPSDLDFVLFLNESVVFLICCLFFMYANGVSTIEYYDNSIKFMPDQYNYTSATNQHIFYNSSGVFVDYSQPLTYSINKSYLMQYRDVIIQKNSWIPILNYYLYFFVFPSINIFYIFYCFFKKLGPFAKKSKDLNTSSADVL